ncbi:Telomere repeat binding factor 1 [Pyrus ussuriensis x Pyrus communis]|uniref:Telomere repeat binding factor 1 n=1 Tax=Pyrus ussuriensis x Pyrus communis TaxID=2448454 RepID=A0A5N5HCC3_9ROSA|nr:Telomere repeat binding factor 1 [Pyrus ussuriensis x Pyrus communis]
MLRMWQIAVGSQNEDEDDAHADLIKELKVVARTSVAVIPQEATAAAARAISQAEVAIAEAEEAAAADAEEHKLLIKENKGYMQQMENGARPLKYIGQCTESFAHLTAG